MRIVEFQSTKSCGVECGKKIKRRKIHKETLFSLVFPRRHIRHHLDVGLAEQLECLPFINKDQIYPNRRKEYLTDWNPAVRKMRQLPQAWNIEGNSGNYVDRFPAKSSNLASLTEENKRESIFVNELSVVLRSFRFQFQIYIFHILILNVNMFKFTKHCQKHKI